jgi:hypothetical protein
MVSCAQAEINRLLGAVVSAFAAVWTDSVPIMTAARASMSLRMNTSLLLAFQVALPHRKFAAHEERHAEVVAKVSTSHKFY